jgi:hypothetical protein
MDIVREIKIQLLRIMNKWRQYWWPNSQTWVCWQHYLGIACTFAYAMGVYTYTPTKKGMHSCTIIYLVFNSYNIICSHYIISKVLQCKILHVFKKITLSWQYMQLQTLTNSIIKPYHVKYFVNPSQNFHISKLRRTIFLLCEKYICTKW